MLAVQVRGLEFNSQHLHKEAGMTMHACNPSFEELGGSLWLAANQYSLIDDHPVPGETLS